MKYYSDDDIRKQFLQLLLWLQSLQLISHVIDEISPLKRNPSMFHQKLLWKDYVAKHGNNDTFIKRHLRMSLKSFDKLLSFIEKDLFVDNVQAARRGGAIKPEIALFSTLRWLAGGSYLDIFAITGVSIGSFYRICYKTINFINMCDELEIFFPTTKK